MQPGPIRLKTPLGLFSLLWALAGSLHYLEQAPLDGLPIYPFAILLFLFPERIWAIALFACAHLILIFSKLPSVANHSVLAALVDGCLVIGCASVISGRNRLTPGRQLWDAIRGPIQATVTVVYFFTILHKLNSSFFDPDVSCATTQIGKMISLHGFKEPADLSIFGANIYITLFAEVVILLFLLWPRFSHVALIVGLLFHTGLAWARFFDFATVIFALYLFFLPWNGIRQRIELLPRWTGFTFFACLSLLCLTSFYFYAYRGNPLIFPTRMWTFSADSLICFFWTMMIWPILWPVFRHSGSLEDESKARSAGLAWLIPAIAVLNGATPYLGLKTVANYSMFSNLRTEGFVTNHFLIPANRFFVAGYQNDLVVVESVKGELPEDLSWFVKVGWTRMRPRWVSDLPEARIPFFELQRALYLWRDLGVKNVSVIYVRDQRRYEVSNAFSDPVLMRPLRFWERKLLAFRVVQKDGEETECRW